MNDQRDLLNEMNDRSREIFRRVVESYLATGTPVGSRTLTRVAERKLSAATIRNVMQDLEYPRAAGKPACLGRAGADAAGACGCSSTGCSRSIRSRRPTARSSTRRGLATTATWATMLDRVGQTLSSLTHGASLVLAPKAEAPIKHIEFVALSRERALVVLVFADGQVENRVFTPPAGLPPSAMREAANFLNAVASGATLSDLRKRVRAEIERSRRQIDVAGARSGRAGHGAVGKRGRGAGAADRARAPNLLEQSDADDLARVRELFDDLERKRDVVEFLELAEKGEGVRIFIGSENKLFSMTGSTLVVSPYMNADRKIIGAVGVIGPTRLNYGRIVPIVDYTAQLVGRILTERAAE
jgi:heat-inducible transcriptional repressor